MKFNGMTFVIEMPNGEIRRTPRQRKLPRCTREITCIHRVDGNLCRCLSDCVGKQPVTPRRRRRNDTHRQIKCGACGHVGITVGDCATECDHCGASVHMDTGKPFRNEDGTVVLCGNFGGRHIP